MFNKFFLFIHTLPKGLSHTEFTKRCNEFVNGQCGIEMGSVLKRVIAVIISALFIVYLAPVLAGAVASYAASTSPTPAAMLVTVFNIFVWAIPLGLGASVLYWAFKSED